MKEGSCIAIHAIENAYAVCCALRRRSSRTCGCCRLRNAPESEVSRCIMMPFFDILRAPDNGILLMEDDIMIVFSGMAYQFCAHRGRRTRTSTCCNLELRVVPSRGEASQASTCTNQTSARAMIATLGRAFRSCFYISQCFASGVLLVG